MVGEHDEPEEPTTLRPAAGAGVSLRQARGRDQASARRPPNATPSKLPVLPYAKPREHRLVRWLRYKREFLLEELVAWKQAAIAVLIGILIVVSFLLYSFPRTTFRLVRFFGGD